MSIRKVSALVIGAIAVGLAIVAWPQYLGLSRAAIAAQIVSLRGLAIVGGLLLAILFGALAVRAVGARRLCAGIGVLLLIFCGANAAVVADRGLDDRPFARSAATDVTVLSWNTLGDAPGAEVIAQLAIDVGAEIVSLPETTRATGVEIARLMEAGGRPMRSYTVAYDETSTSRSTTLLISVELGEYDVNEAATTTAVLPTIVAIPRSASRPTVVAVHTLAPIPPMMLAWQKDLEWVAAACSGDNVIIAGDFNATLDHFAGLPHTDGGTLGNCGDAALATHTAAAGTWPTALPMLLGSPIDHVLATPNWRVSGMRVVQLDDSYGSDHRPILVQLSPAD